MRKFIISALTVVSIALVSQAATASEHDAYLNKSRIQNMVDKQLDRKLDNIELHVDVVSEISITDTVDNILSEQP